MSAGDQYERFPFMNEKLFASELTRGHPFNKNCTADITGPSSIVNFIIIVFILFIYLFIYFENARNINFFQLFKTI